MILRDDFIEREPPTSEKLIGEPAGFGLSFYFSSFSADGGGLRGAYCALLLEGIEAQLRSRGIITRSIAEKFNLISGTSTGAIIAGALAADRTAAEIAALYLTTGRQIFRRKRLWRILLPRKRYLGFPEGALYSARPLERALAKELGAVRLSQTTHKVLLPTYLLSSGGRRGPALLRGGQGYFTGPDLLLSDAIRASAAAPVYLAPKELELVNGSRHIAVDGGLFANNPSYLNHVELKRLWESKWPGAPRGRQVILSIGTGVDDDARSPRRAKAALASWIYPWSKLFLVDQMMHAQSAVADHLLRQSQDVSLYRLNFELEPKLFKMDDRKVIPILRRKVERILTGAPSTIEEERTIDILEDFLLVADRMATPTI